MDEHEFRDLGHELVDRLADYLETVEDKALYPNVEPAALEALFDEPLLQDGVVCQNPIERLHHY